MAVDHPDDQYKAPSLIPQREWDQLLIDCEAEIAAENREAHKQAARLIAEHTGHPCHVIADEIADALLPEHQLTSGERCLIAALVDDYVR
jgi:hypothetical protein